MTVLYTRWRFDNYTQKPNFTYQKILLFFLNCETLFTILSYRAQNSFHFDDIFHRKFKIPILVCVALRRHLVAILGNFGTKIDLSLLDTPEYRLEISIFSKYLSGEFCPVQWPLHMPSPDFGAKTDQASILASFE